MPIKLPLQSIFCFPLKGLILKHCLYSMFLLVKENVSMVCCVVACQRSVHSCQEYRSVEQDQRQGPECEHEVYKSTALVLPSHDFCTTHIHQSHVRATLRHSSLQQGTQATVLTYLIPTENDIKSNWGHLFYSMGKLHTKALQLHHGLLCL